MATEVVVEVVEKLLYCTLLTIMELMSPRVTHTLLL